MRFAFDRCFDSVVIRMTGSVPLSRTSTQESSELTRTPNFVSAVESFPITFSSSFERLFAELEDIFSLTLTLFRTMKYSGISLTASETEKWSLRLSCKACDVGAEYSVLKRTIALLIDYVDSVPVAIKRNACVSFGCCYHLAQRGFAISRRFRSATWKIPVWERVHRRGFRGRLTVYFGG